MMIADYGAFCNRTQRVDYHKDYANGDSMRFRDSAIGPQRQWRQKMVESLDEALNLLIVEVTRPLARNLGETEKATELGLRMAVVALVEAFQQRAADSECFDRAFKLIDDYGRINVNAGAETYSSPASTAVGNSLIDVIFGADRTNVTEEIAHAARLEPPAAARVLNVAAVLLLSSLEPASAPQSWDRLADEASRHPLPPPSKIEGSPAAKPTNLATPDRGKTPSSMFSWLLLTAATLAIVGLTWRFPALPPTKEASPSARSDAGAKSAEEMPLAHVTETAPAPQREGPPTGLNGGLKKSREDVPETPVREAPSAAAKELASPGITEAAGIMKPAQNAGDPGHNFIRRKLPNGVELSIPKTGVENNLLEFLELASNKSGEFDLDRVWFDKGKTTLQSSSKEQLQNLTKILKAYPSAEVVINSYTDNLGNRSHNLKLSRERANNVVQELARMGVDKSRMTARGFGDDHPIASNNSEEGRTQNRRVSLSVAESRKAGPKVIRTD
jgi:outer membrane protein OmpA-like peptidoglycan-associated protein